MDLAKLTIGPDMQMKAIAEWLSIQQEQDEFLKNSIAVCPDTSLTKCYGYIKDKAKAKAVNGCAMIKDDVVFGWAKEYFIDYEARSAKEKEENEKKEKAEREAKALKEKEIKVAKVEEQEEDSEEDDEEPVKPVQPIKPKEEKKSESLNLFDF